MRFKRVAEQKRTARRAVKNARRYRAATQATLQLATRGGAETNIPFSQPLMTCRKSEKDHLIPSTQARIQEILGELKAGLERVYGDQLRGVYLFGSYARGEADWESDLDVLVVLNAFDRYAQEVDRTGVLAADLSLKYGVTISMVFMREQRMVAWRCAFFVQCS